MSYGITDCMAQSVKWNEISKKVLLNSDSIFLDSNIIAISTLQLNKDNLAVPDSLFHYNASSKHLIWYGSLPTQINVRYRYLKINLEESFRKRDPTKIESNLDHPDHIYSWQANEGDNNDIFGFSSLNKSGSISRGISFGNSQDLGVNSNLSLQLNGKVSEEISILASITDDNIPIQPEGNTLQLQDFDQAFIQLFTSRSKLTAGDFWLRRPKSYFLTYQKKVQGVSFKTDLMNDSDEHNFWKVSTGMALSKGKFSRNRIQGQEGNQGPYKLIGASNERYIIVLSGSERVFIDGRLLTRGQNNDYVIDYNTAEVTFTPKNLITKDRRIIVEFQYSDKNYARSLLQLSSEYKKNKWAVDFNAYSEQDSKNQPLQQTISDEQELILNSVGDNLELAYSPGIDSIGYSTDLNLYKKLDSLGYPDVYVYSTNTDSAFYQISFTQVGQGNGNYVFEDFTSFGRIYKWVKPDTVSGTIVLKGDFEPVLLLVPPQKRQMVTLGANYSFSKNTKLGFEGALTNKDLNTFSSLDAGDNVGYGLEGHWTTNKPLSKDTNGWVLTNKINAEYRDANFSRIERYRLVEFERNWNLLGKNLTGDQIMGQGELGIKKSGIGSIGYFFNTFNSIDEFSGVRNGISANLKKKGTKIQYKGILTQTSGFETTNFFRHKTNLSQDLRWLRVGFIDEFERNQFNYGESDSLLSNSYQFYDWKAYVSNVPDRPQANQFQIYYRQRNDKVVIVSQNRLSPATSAQHYGVSLGLTNNPKQKLITRVEYRQLRIVNDTDTTIKPDETLLGRLEYSVKILKGFVKSATFYEIGSGQELRKQFAYVQVQAGQGVYAWNDYNQDGIKDINEFEISAFPDQADYIRVFTPTSDYVKTYSNQFNQSINLRPSAILKKKKGFLKFFAHFYNQTSFRIDRKTNNESETTAYNPFITAVEESTLVSLNSSIRNTLFFNRSHPKYGFDYTYQKIGGKSLLTSGFDSRALEEHELRIRWNVNRKFTFISHQSISTKSNFSDYTTGRNYNLQIWSVDSKISYQPSTSFRVSLTNETSGKQNALDLGGEVAEIIDVGAEFRLNKATKGAMTVLFNYINISYDGEVNSSLGFEMLNGLKNGTNFTWNANFQRTLANNLQISLNYLGRKSEDNKAIHTGGVQVRAFF